MARYTVIIGRSEPADIVGVALAVPVKVDTGAYRSSIHASEIKLIKDENGDKVLSFNILGHPCSPIKRAMRVNEFDTVTVRSSNGQEQDRYEVKLKIKLGNKIFTTSFSLADRSYNMFPVLIGRKTMKGRYLVDVDVSNVNKQQMVKDFGVNSPRDEEDSED